MIIILNGMYGTYIQELGKVISYTLNSVNKNAFFEFDNSNSLNLNFKNENIASESIIHTDNTDNIIFQNENENIIFDDLNKICAIENLTNYFADSYSFDIGFIDVPAFFEDDIENFIFNKIDFSPEKIVERYTESNLDYYVVAGQIGKYMIDKIIAEAGSENVKVYNILRNPANVYCLTKNNFSSKKIISNALASYLLSTLDYVETFKFEDLKNNINIENNEIKTSEFLKFNFDLLISEFINPEKETMFSKENIDFIKKHFSKIKAIDYFYSLEDFEEFLQPYFDLNNINFYEQEIDLFKKLNYKGIK